MIVEELASREKWDLAGAGSIQLSVKSVPWREVRDAVLSCWPSAGTWSDLELLRSWDGNLASDSHAAALFEVFMANLAEDIARAKAPNSWHWVLGKGSSILNLFGFFAYRRFEHLVDLVRSQPDGWFQDGWAAAIIEAITPKNLPVRS